MKWLAPVLVRASLGSLAGAVGAVIGYIAAAVLEFAYGQYNPTFFWKYDDPADQWVYDAYCNAGALVGAVGGLLLGVWLAERLLAARRAQ